MGTKIEMGGFSNFVVEEMSNIKTKIIYNE